uniref:TyrKc domain-containing protein n=1 Tax=Macrostomum lignano TaxID=282301 RepID=A0A1I8F7B6_9PLAT
MAVQIAQGLAHLHKKRIVHGDLACRNCNVWSFGVTLWELITRCLPPYPHTQPKDMLNYLTAGHRLGKPTNCPDQLFSIMASCWSPCPRPGLE